MPGKKCRYCGVTITWNAQARAWVSRILGAYCNAQGSRGRHDPLPGQNG